MHFTTVPSMASIPTGFRAVLAAGVVFCGLFMAVQPSLALSEIKREELPPPAATQQAPAASPDNSVPMPDPIAPPAVQEPGAAPQAPATTPEEPEQVEPAEPDSGASFTPDLDPNAPPPEVVYDLSRLPEPVRRMHDLLVEAAKTGDVEKLRPLMGTGDSAPELSLGEVEGDQIAFLRGLSGDTEGQEILAIMEEILDAGYVHLGEGTPNDVYVWPYFFGVPLDKLDARQRVELFKIITAGDYEDMKTYGSYIFYRLGITPEGRWAFFVAGD